MVTESLTYPPFRFVLSNPDTGESLTLTSEPLEWASTKMLFDRKIEIGGVFTSLVVDSLTFINEGADFIRKIWVAKEMNGNCNLTIGWWKFSIRDYVDFPTSYSLDFANEFKPNVKIDEQSIGLNISTKNESEFEKFSNRRKTKVDISKNQFNVEKNEWEITTIGGQTIVDYPALKKNFNMPAFDIYQASSWIDTLTTQKIINNSGSTLLYTTFQMDISTMDYSETTAVAYATDLNTQNLITNFFSASLEDRTFDFIYDITVEVTNRKGGFLNATDVYEIRVEEINVGVVNQYVIANFGRTKGVKNYTGTISIPVTTGNKLRVYIETDAVENVDADILTSSFQIKETVANTEAKTVEGFPLYESFERVLQHYLDTQYPFYSEFLGRLDTPYNLDGDCYLSEDQLRFANMFSGLNLRGALLLDNDNPLALSYDTLYGCANSIYNLGYGTETIDDFFRIRIEEYAFFFKDVEIADLSSRITRLDITTETISDLAYLGIKTGFKDSNPLIVNGRGEYNTQSEFTTILNTDNEFDNVSDIQAGTAEITKKLAEELTNEDTEEDNSLFIIKSQRDGDEWKPEFDENIEVDNSSSLFGGQSLNLYYTPIRNLIRHGVKFKAALTKYLSSYIRFQTAGKNQTLQTTGTVDSGFDEYTVKENQDILVDNLTDPIWKPISHTVEIYFDNDDLETLMAQPMGYYTFSSTITGYVLRVEKPTNENKAVITIIERYVN